MPYGVYYAFAVSSAKVKSQLMHQEKIDLNRNFDLNAYVFRVSF